MSLRAVRALEAEAVVVVVALDLAVASVGDIAAAQVAKALEVVAVGDSVEAAAVSVAHLGAVDLPAGVEAVVAGAVAVWAAATTAEKAAPKIQKHLNFSADPGFLSTISLKKKKDQKEHK